MSNPTGQPTESDEAEAARIADYDDGGWLAAQPILTRDPQLGDLLRERSHDGRVRVVSLFRRVPPFNAEDPAPGQVILHDGYWGAHVLAEHVPHDVENRHSYQGQSISMEDPRIRRAERLDPATILAAAPPLAVVRANTTAALPRLSVFAFLFETDQEEAARLAVSPHPADRWLSAIPVTTPAVFEHDLIVMEHPDGRRLLGIATERHPGSRVPPPETCDPEAEHNRRLHDGAWQMRILAEATLTTSPETLVGKLITVGDGLLRRSLKLDPQELL